MTPSRSISEIGCQKIALTDIEDVLVRPCAIPPVGGSLEVQYRIHTCICVCMYVCM